MQLFVVGLDGSTFTVRCSSRTVEEVKDLVEEAEGIPLPLQRLWFQGKELEGRALEHYSVQDGSTIHLTMNLEGGYLPSNLRILAEWHLINKQICRKCYGRLSPTAKRCHKAKCGRTADIRPKKTFFRNKRFETAAFKETYGENLRLHKHCSKES